MSVESPPLRVLFVTSSPWQETLGASRVLIELSDELRRLGHIVEKFSIEDAFPGPPRPPGLLRHYPRHYRTVFSFPAKARAFLRERAARFDVVDAIQSDLPYSKRRLGFEGLLVSRSVALAPAYLAFDRFAARKWPAEKSSADILRRLLGYPPYRRRLAQANAGFRHADLINVSSRDDLEILGHSPALHPKVFYQPLGIQEHRLRQLSSAALPPERRLETGTVVFIGSWNLRKGARDWPKIAAQISSLVPGSRFRFLGTGFAAEHVLSAFAPELRRRCEVVPSFDSDRLPSLLADATVGLFPSYCEGFGLAVLEKLAAGLPTIAYDAPGPRDILASSPEACMAPVGDTAAIARLATEALTAGAARYRRWSASARERAGEFLWPAIAETTAARYRSELDLVAGAGASGARRLGSSG